MLAQIECLLAVIITGIINGEFAKPFEWRLRQTLDFCITCTLALVVVALFAHAASVLGEFAKLAADEIDGIFYLSLSHWRCANGAARDGRRVP